MLLLDGGGAFTGGLTLPGTFNQYQPSLGISFYLNETGVFPPRDGGSPDGSYIGIVNMFAGLPNYFGSALNGQLLPIAQNQALFALLGTTYGGNGVSSFALPDLRAAAMIGAGQGPGLSNQFLGAPVGAAGTVISQSLLPPSSGGGSSAFNNLEPSLPLTFGIAVFGVFPSQNGATLDSLGTVAAFTENFVPGGYLPCDGRLLSIAEYDALFALIGTTFGGDGQITFALPDLRGRAVVGTSNTAALGQVSGTENSLISLANMPVEMGGQGLPISNAQPSIALNYLIATQGIFPSRDAVGTDSSTPYVGQIITTAYNFVPKGFLRCEGQLLPISQNQALFALIGTTYGGNGVSNFALPDLRNKLAIEAGTSIGGVTVGAGENVGSATSTLTMADIPALNFSGTAADDSLYGGNLGDVINGLGGKDTIIGNGGTDQLSGNAGDDTFIGGAGADTLNGGADRDTASYSTSATGVAVNLLTGAGSGGDAQGDILISIENVTGSSNGDVLTGDGANNVLNGGAGNDVLIGGLGADTLIGGADSDTVDYSAYLNGVSINLATGVGADGDGLQQIENATGSAFGDVLIGDNGANTMRGGAGNDFLVAGNGADFLDGQGDLDTVSYATATGGVFVNLGTGTGANGGVLANIENILGSAFGDVLYGDNGANTINGGAGNDFIFAGNGADNMIGGADLDTVSYETATTGVFANLGTGIGANGGVLSEIENLTGSNFGDVLYGSAIGNTIKGGAGNDFIVGGAGSDALYGGADADTFRYEAAGYGGDVIVDFQDNLDKLSFNTSIATSISNFTIANNGTTNVSLSIAGQTILVQSVSNITLTATDFMFVV